MISATIDIAIKGDLSAGMFWIGVGLAMFGKFL